MVLQQTFPADDERACAIMVAMLDAFFSRRLAIWRPAAQLSRASVPDRYLPWLLDPSSLTQRIMAVCHGRFRVEVLSLGWARPLPDERRRLNLREGERALVRQVQLMCDERPWVYARTVIPRATLSGRERRLAHLGTRPLGAALFADPTMEREAVEVARVLRGSTLFALATRGPASAPAEVWGRRSVFRIGKKKGGKPLLVSEIFLPEIPEAPCR